MSVIGLLLFIVIVGSSSLYYRRKREVALKELKRTREETRDAIQTLHSTISH